MISFDPEVPEQVILVCHGGGSNGKTTLFGAVRGAMGDYAHNAPFNTFEKAYHAGVPTDVADLDGRRFVTASETSETTRLNEARIKVLSGSDPITARHLYGRFFTYLPSGKLWLAVNHRPAVTDDSHGFWRRVRLIPFTRQFAEHEQDRRLIDALRDEAPGILAWLVRGCLDWQRFGLHPPNKVRAATDAYREDSDAIAPFLEAACECGDGFNTASRELFQAYEAYCDEEHIPTRERLTRNAFGRRMGDKFDGKKNREGKVYMGVKVRTGVSRAMAADSRGPILWLERPVAGANTPRQWRPAPSSGRRWLPRSSAATSMARRYCSGTWRRTSMGCAPRCATWWRRSTAAWRPGLTGRPSCYARH